MLAEGCRLTLSGGGLLYTREADAKTFADIERAIIMIDGLKSEIFQCNEDKKRIKEEYLLKISALSEANQSDIRGLKKAHGAAVQKASIVYGVSGFIVGAIASFFIW